MSYIDLSGLNDSEHNNLHNGNNLFNIDEINYDTSLNDIPFNDISNNINERYEEDSTTESSNNDNESYNEDSNNLEPNNKESIQGDSNQNNLKNETSLKPSLDNLFQKQDVRLKFNYLNSITDDNNKIKNKIKELDNMKDIIENPIFSNELNNKIYEFQDHISEKIISLDRKMFFAENKYLDTRRDFNGFSISIIVISTILTLFEAFINVTDIERVNRDIKNIIQIIPLILSTGISLLAALVKFNKYEEKIEDLSRTTEKCIYTIAELKKVDEDLRFCKDQKQFNKIEDNYLNNIYKLYLTSNTEIEKLVTEVEITNYLQMMADNEIKQAKLARDTKKILNDIENNLDQK